MSETSHTLAELAALLKAEIHGDADCIITDIAPLNGASTGHISILHHPRFRKHLPNTGASAVVVSAADLDNCPVSALVVNNPQLGYLTLATFFTQKRSHHEGIHPTAIIAADCEVAANVAIGPHCVIGKKVKIGENTVLGAGCVVGDETSIGADCVVYANVTLYHNVHIGTGVVIHSGAVIGADGFGIVQQEGIWQKIPQLGGVMIGDCVEVGANTTIDRGALGNTVIEEGVKLDNQIQVAHNVHIGAHTAVAGCVAIAGSTRIGKHCMIGGSSAITGHTEIADHVVLAGRTSVSKTITKAGVYSSGIPARPVRLWRKAMVHLFRLDEIMHRLKKLEKMHHE